jgi:CTP:molybdopterin cytidylyltransferase MocA
VIDIALDDPAIALDIDTPEALKAARQQEKDVSTSR